ncbi:hypothetical protein [Parafrankia sp. BMG5.11]|uniref:hypothetical protein n=1 Tax=Parafrankia sp. BMG5.11 TaxID=222540 RepID=UPI001FB3082C|nr:hypothetical protein [Parafrankia sp. BMG5.11]
MIRSVTRDGRVRAYEEMWPGGRPVRVATTAWKISSLVDGSGPDAARAVAIARAHTFPGHRQVRPWASIAEARAALSPARTPAP